MTARSVIGILLCAALTTIASPHGTTRLLAQSGYTTTTIATGSGPFDIAVNPATNKIYVSNSTSQNVSVIDGTTDSVVATVDTPFSTNPQFITVNPTTNRIYVTYGGNFGGGLVEGVMMIDGSTDTLAATFLVGTHPGAMALDPSRNVIYVPNGGSSTVSVIDGSIDNGSDVHTRTIPVSDGAVHLAVNPVTNKIYVTSGGTGGIGLSNTTLTTIDGTTFATTPMPLGFGADGVAVNPVTNKIYISGAGGFVGILDGNSNSLVTVTVDGRPAGDIAVNSTSNKVYLTSSYNADGSFSNIATVIDGASNATADITVGSFPGPVAVDPVLDKVYVANAELLSGTSDVTVIEGSDHSVIATIPVGFFPFAIAVNPFTHKVYTADNTGNDVTVMTPPLAGNTPTGTNVSVTPASGLTVTFNQVTAAGDTTAVAVTSPPPPAGFQVDGSIYDVSTTATYVPPVTVCFAYSPSDLNPRLYHYESGQWADRTVSVDTVNHIVCGQVSSLSPFAVLKPAAPPQFTAAAPPSTAIQGGQYAYTFTASGLPAPTFALASGAPSWLSIGATSGLVSGTPPSGTTTFTYSVVATNGVAPDATAGPFVVTIVAPPQFTGATPPLTATQGVQYAYTFTASGVPAPTFALASGAPPWLSVSATTGLVSGTPPSGTTTFTYSVIATNGVAPDATAGPFVVTVSAAAGTSADLSISIAGSATTARGSTTTYTIVVTNRGPLAAEEGTVAMIVGPGATFVSADPAPLVNTSGLWFWRFETLDAGASATFSLCVKLNKAGVAVGLGTVRAETRDTTLINNVALALTVVR